MFLLALCWSGSAFSVEYACSIKHVLQLNDTGQYIDHGWAANYLNRKFFFDSETGKVTGTTALKARLTNFDKTHAPVVLRSADERASYKAVTVFAERGQFAAIRLYRNVEAEEIPYTYQTAVGMVLTGTCAENGPAE